MSDKPVIGFAGMTHLGLVSATACAERGFAVTGFDPDPALIRRIGRGELPVAEPGLDEAVARQSGRLGFTANPADLGGCDVVYIAADVPTDDRACSDLAPIRALIDRVAPHLAPGAVLVVLCQVPPGFTRGLTVVPPPRLVYQVETLIFGRALERALHPERIIIGLADPQAPLPAAYAALLAAFDCPLLPMGYESAELAKIAINFCLVASVTVANTLAELSESIGADWAEIAPALKLDRRIGPQAYLSPGLGLSGGNLERDLRTVLTLAAARGTHAGMVEAWIDNSEHRKDWPWRVLRPLITPASRIAVLGLAYKENTHSTKNSPALRLLSHLEGHAVTVHDPVVPAATVPSATGAASALDCARGADILVIATPWPDYRALDPAALARVMHGRVIADPYGMLDGRKAAAAGFAWHSLGRPPLMPEEG